MRHLQTHLGRVFGLCGKAKRKPAEYTITWADGTKALLTKHGKFWEFEGQDGWTHGFTYQQHAMSEVAMLGGTIERRV
jgi:hypothetical protein